MAEMWPRYGRDVAEIWPRHSPRCGRDLAEMYLLCGGDVEVCLLVKVAEGLVQEDGGDRLLHRVPVDDRPPRVEHVPAEQSIT